MNVIDTVACIVAAFTGGYILGLYKGSISKHIYIKNYYSMRREKECDTSVDSFEDADATCSSDDPEDDFREYVLSDDNEEGLEAKSSHEEGLEAKSSHGERSEEKSSHGERSEEKSSHEDSSEAHEVHKDVEH